MSKVNQGKVAIVGCGFVGSASAFAVMQSAIFNERSEERRVVK